MLGFFFLEISTSKDGKESGGHSPKLHFQTENSALVACESQTAVSNQLLLISPLFNDGVTHRLWALLKQTQC